MGYKRTKGEIRQPIQMYALRPFRTHQQAELQESLSPVS